MTLEQSLPIAAPADQVWAALIDLERAVPCLPGAELEGPAQGGGQAASLKLKMGPATAVFAGTVRLEHLDEHARSGQLTAEGNDRRGQGTAAASLTFRVRPAGDAGTRLELTTDYRIMGRLAHLGRDGTVDRIAEALSEGFRAELEASLVAGGAATAAQTATGAAPAAQTATGPAPAQNPPGAQPAPTQITPAVPVTPMRPAAMPAPEASGRLTVVTSAIWEQAKGNALQLAALVVGFLLALRVLGRRDD